MGLLNPDIQSLVRFQLSRPPWRVTDIYNKAKKVDGNIARMGLEKFRQKYIVPVLNGEEPETESTGRSTIEVPDGLEYRLRKRWEKMDRKEKESQDHVHECPMDGCIGGSKNRAGLARHIDSRHPNVAEELREMVGLDPEKAAPSTQTKTTKRREPRIISPEVQEEILELLKQGLKATTLPPREQIRSAFIEFAKETRGSEDPLDLIASLETYVDLVYDLFSPGEVEDE